MFNILGKIPSNGYNAVRAALDPNDPNYLKKMAMIGGVEGHHELNASNTQPDYAKEANEDSTDPSVQAALAKNTKEHPNSYVSPMAPMKTPQDPGVAPQMAAPTVGPNAAASVAPMGAPARPHEGVLSHIGHGLETAGNVAGDVFAPGTMSLIPGTQLYNERQKGIQFARSQQELKTQTELEREQEEADYRRGLIQNDVTKTGNAKDVADRAAADREAKEKFDESYKSGQQSLAKAKQDFDSGMANKKYDLAVDALSQRVDEFGKNFKLSEGKLLDQQQRTNILQQGIDIHRDAQELMRQAKASNDERFQREVGVKIANLYAEHPEQKELGLIDEDVLAQAKQYAEAPAKISSTSSKTSGNSPKVGDTKKFPNGKTGKWDGHGWVAQ